MIRPIALFFACVSLVACGNSTSDKPPGVNFSGGSGGHSGATGGSGGATGGSGGATGGSGGVTGGTGGMSGGSGGASGGSGGVAGGGGTQNSGACNGDGDCNGGTCVELSPGGYRVCKNAVTEATQCTAGSLDECCKSSDCTTGKCYKFPLTPYCGGAQPVDHNVCGSDQCTSASACVTSGNGMCVPAGVWGYQVSACLTVKCFKDSECKAESGGKCTPIFDPCCNEPTGLFCVYPSNGCTDGSSCSTDQHCGTEQDSTHGGEITAHCLPGGVVCPA